MNNLSGFVKRLRDIMRNDAGINGDAQRIEQIAWMLFLKVYDAKEQDWAFDDERYVSILPEVCRWANWAHDDKSGSAMTGDKLLGFVNNTLFPVLKGKDVKDASGKTIVEGIRVTAQTPIKKAIVQTVFADANQYMKDGVLLRQVINVIDELDLSDYEESHAFNEIYEGILKELQSAGSAGEFYTPRAVTDFMARMIQPRIGEQMADFACGTGGFITSWLGELQKQIKNTADAKKYGDSIYGIEKKQFPYMLCITNLLLHGLDVPQVFHDNTLLHDVLDYTEKDQFDVILMNPPYGGSEKKDVKNHFPDDLASSETADLFMSVIMYRLRPGGRAAVILLLATGVTSAISIVLSPARRLPVRHGQREGEHQKEAAQRVQPAHGHPHAGQCLCAVHLHYHQHPVLRPHRPDAGDVVLPAGHAGGLQAFLQDQAHEAGALRPGDSVVAQPAGDRGGRL